MLTPREYPSLQLLHLLFISNLNQFLLLSKALSTVTNTRLKAEKLSLAKETG